MLASSASVLTPPLPMRLFVTALAALFALPTLAQDVALTPEPAQDASFDVGVQSLDLRYTPGAATAPLVDYNSDVYAMGFYGKNASFTAYYGSDDRPITADVLGSMSVYGLDISVGTNVPVARFGRVETFVPVRLQLAPRYFLGDTDADLTGDDTSLFVASTALGVGVGAATEIPLGPAGFASSIRTFGTAVAGAGVQGDYVMGHPTASKDPSVHGLGTRTLMAQVEARRLFGSPLGASLGYSFRNTQIDGSGLGAGGVFEAVVGAGESRRLETSHLIHVGLIF